MPKLKAKTDIPSKVREKVLDRDSYDGAPCCIVCGAPYGIELHHLVSRGRGGMGVETNLVCLCQKHHMALHNGDSRVKNYCKEYLESHYDGWTEQDQIFRRDK